MTPGLFGDHWVSGSLEGVMHAPLHMFAVLLCSAYTVFSCSLPFLGYPPFPPPLFFIVAFIIHPAGSPLSFQFSVMGAGAGFFWWVGLVAGLQRGQALRCSSCLGLGVSTSSPHVPGHTTSICNEGIKYKIRLR